MRATDLVSEMINPDTRHSEFSHELEIDGITYRAINSGEDLVIKAYTPENVVVGAAKFLLPKQDTHAMSSTWTKVAPLFKKQGIASNMYAYARMLGNSIKPANFQLDAGRKMWDKWRENGDAKHLKEDDSMFSSRDRTSKVPAAIIVGDSEFLLQGKIKSHIIAYATEHNLKIFGSVPDAWRLEIYIRSTVDEIYPLVLELEEMAGNDYVVTLLNGKWDVKANKPFISESTTINPQ